VPDHLRSQLRRQSGASLWGIIVKERGEDAVTPQVADVIFLEIELLMGQ